MIFARKRKQHFAARLVAGVSMIMVTISTVLLMQIRILFLGSVVTALENNSKIVSLGSGLGGQSFHFVVSVVKGLFGGIVTA